MLAKSIDGVEHSAILKRVMAGARNDMQNMRHMRDRNNTRSSRDSHSECA